MAPTARNASSVAAFITRRSTLMASPSRIFGAHTRLGESYALHVPAIFERKCAAQSAARRLLCVTYTVGLTLAVSITRASQTQGNLLRRLATPCASAPRIFRHNEAATAPGPPDPVFPPYSRGRRAPSARHGHHRA